MQSKHSAAVLAAISGVPFIMVLGNSMLIPVLPAMKQIMSLSRLEVSMLITAFSIPGLLIPVAGFLSDRIGRKKVIIPGLLLYGLGSVIAGAAAIILGANAYTWLIVGRVIQGIGAAATTPIAMALTGDLFTGPQRSKALGIVEAANGMGKVLSPVLGAAIGLIAWYAAFILFPVVVAPIVLGMWLLVREPENKQKKQSVSQYARSIKKIFQHKSALLLTSFLGGMIALLILFGILFFLSDYLETQVGIFGIVKGLALAAPVLLMSATSLVTGIFLKKQLMLLKWLAVTGLGLIALSLTALIFFQNIYFFFAAISITGVGTGLLLPCLNTIITGSVAAAERGLITAVYGSVRFLGVAAGPPFFGYLMEQSNTYMYIAGGALAGITALLTAGLLRVQDMSQPEQAGQSGQPEPPPVTTEFVFSPSPARKPQS
ncbi:MAG: MFS transporter [Firmicutes bacterium]|nr:MFS transporter [Bacillota bacterium]